MQSVKLFRLLSIVSFLFLSGCSLFVSKPVAVDTQASVLGPIDANLQQGFTEALALMQNEQFIEAEVLLLDLTAKYPDFAGPWSNLALAQGKLEKFDLALISLNKALEVDEKFCQAQSYKGVVLRELGQFTQARDQYLLALSCNPNDELTLYNLGVLSDLYLHDEVAALDYYQRYVQAQGPEPDETVQSWIVDLKRRVPAAKQEPAEAEQAIVPDGSSNSVEPQLAGEE